MSQAQSPKAMSLVEKYAVPYYFSTIQFAVCWCIYLKTHQPWYMMAFLIMQNYLGKLLPKDSAPVTNSRQHNRNIYHVFPMVVNVLCTWATLALVFIDYPVQNYTNHQTVGLVLALGILLSTSIDASHELFHRPQTVFKGLGFINMVIFQFSVYLIEHLYLHHKYVGTAKDPITSPKNQSSYLYAIRAYFSAHKFTFEYSKLAFLGCVLANWSYLLVLFYFSWKELQDLQLALRKVGFFVAVGATGFYLMECIEYIEHYGLIYRQDKDKQQINEISSWNSQLNIIHNWLVFRFQRHSDHHMNAYKIFTTLELTDSMPRFPFNFVEGVYMAFIPPIFRYVMNPYVDEILEKKPVSVEHRKATKYIKQGVYLAFTVLNFVHAYRAYNGL